MQVAGAYFAPDLYPVPQAHPNPSSTMHPHDTRGVVLQ
jgi:hypothetical protein